jgi:hypothetical protein
VIESPSNITQLRHAGIVTPSCAILAFRIALLAATAAAECAVEYSDAYPIFPLNL